MYAWQEKNLVDEKFPFNLFIAEDIEFPPHWHEEIEIVYVLDEKLTMGLNSEIYHLQPRDILLIGQGEVHYFLSQPRLARRIIIQFSPAIFQSFAALMRNRRFISPLVQSESITAPGHHQLEQQILLAKKEYDLKQEGFQLAIMARLYDLITILLRCIPTEKYTTFEKNRQLQKLARLEQVFQYVEQNYTQSLTLSEVATATGFSVYHFTRFFKEITGMTFMQYYNNFRIAQVVKELNESDDTITAIAFRSGFNSIQTFNRVFKQIKGSSPTSYQKNS